MHRALLVACVVLAQAACAPTGGRFVSEDARPLGGNLFVEGAASEGRFLVLDGEISRDTAFVFLTFSEQFGPKGLVILNSPGGDVLAAHQIGREIKRRDMNALVVDRCLSACVDIFVAGKNREMVETAVLGVHAPVIRSRRWWWPFSTISSDEGVEMSYLIDRAYWREMGFPRINEAAYEVPNDRIWIIESDRASELRLATNILE